MVVPFCVKDEDSTHYIRYARKKNGVWRVTNTGVKHKIFFTCDQRKASGYGSAIFHVNRVIKFIKLKPRPLFMIEALNKSANTWFSAADGSLFENLSDAYKRSNSMPIAGSIIFRIRDVVKGNIVLIYYRDSNGKHIIFSGIQPEVKCEGD